MLGALPGGSRRGELASSVAARSEERALLVTGAAPVEAQGAPREALRAAAAEPGGEEASAGLLWGAWRPPPDERAVARGGGAEPERRDATAARREG
ncbi:hypothetical protein WME97_04060 [Sorangium sp. So ce367]|uniref:hypothetical protein n=1 Tax=Sorangium sp. So ce367 TaxID=3133305 RepID=UPI003F61A73C